MHFNEADLWFETEMTVGLCSTLPLAGGCDLTDVAV